jgi:hypothetical protein
MVLLISLKVKHLLPELLKLIFSWKEMEIGHIVVFVSTEHHRSYTSFIIVQWNLIYWSRIMRTPFSVVR